jgi:NADPH-dependent 2,4-dienoyl-CoA reductase/sulfur reductase-like enzyme
VIERVRTEIAVVGAGPAGLAAAVHAREASRSVLLVDGGARPGGQIWRHRHRPPRAARAWLDRLARSGASVLDEANVIDAPEPRRLLVERCGKAVEIACDSLVLATGARERLLPFPGWTLPGVIGAGAAQALRESGARFAGLRVVVAGSGPLLLAVAAALRRDGARVVGVVEQAPRTRVLGAAAALVLDWRRLAQAVGAGAALAGVPYRTGAWVVEAGGRERLERVLVRNEGCEWSWSCDVLACGFGLVPNLELPRLLGCETSGDAVVVDTSQQTSRRGVFAAGELGGVAGVGHALVTGSIAGSAAAGQRVPAALMRRRARERRFAARMDRCFALRAELRTLARPDTIVCRCEDVSMADVREAAARAPGLRGVKLHTRAGMGPCQGRVCGSALAFLFGFDPDSVRPPLLPVPIALLAESGAAAQRPEEER